MLGDGRARERKPRKCRYCGVELNDSNWYPSSRVRHNLVCKSCQYSKTVKPYRQRNRERYNLQQKEYKNKHQIGSNSWTFRSKEEINRPEICPICGSNKTKATINFHHWQEDPIVGIWVCRKCHNIIHRTIDMCGSVEEWYKRFSELKSNPIILNAKPIKKGRGNYRKTKYEYKRIKIP